MSRYIATFPVNRESYRDIKRKMLSWGNQFSIFVFYDSNEYASKYGRYECLLGVGNESSHAITDLGELDELYGAKKDWWMGHIAYDYKNRIETKLRSEKPQRVGFTELQFFCPEIVCYVDKDITQLTIESKEIDPKKIFQDIVAGAVHIQKSSTDKITFEQRIDKTSYTAIIDRLRQHIEDGDCYEINLCNEGNCEGLEVDTLSTYEQLSALSPAPFGVYYKLQDKYMMCASPERYIQKREQKLICQPIKGTARRSNNPDEDTTAKEQLYHSEKERAENVMIVDLTRSDLAKVCERGSVQVDELFGLYTFPQVHQMISTVSGKLRKAVGINDIIQSTFPMGSMTGAPKVMVMELIEAYEASRRELFSGTVGYLNPEGDFDFNVVIRSLFYNAAKRYLSYQTGGAITYDSNPEQEWEEMRLKAWAMERIFF